jgi:zinc dependent phospholipase C
VRFVVCIALVAVAFAVYASQASAFSVLAHQAVIDETWDATLAPAITRRFPGADLERARPFAYGGSHVADLGYFPLGSQLFTDLVHYVRTGAFIANLLAVARDADEYAFALGALGHYVTDTVGHPEATNRVVPEIYPKLRAKFGDRVTYADDHASHLQTEFRFDAFQMARTKGGRDIFHHALQFEVATRALDEAFAQTYGLRLDDVFTNTDAAILTYRYAFRGVIQEATGIAWELYRADIQALDPEMTPAGFVYDLSKGDFEKEFGAAFAEPGYFAKFFAFLVKLVPNVGPLKRSVFKPLPPEARERYTAALGHAVARYRSAVATATAKHLDLPEQNLDTATPVVYGSYAPADHAYAELRAKLADRAIPAALRADLRRFYGGADAAEGVSRERRVNATKTVTSTSAPATLPTAMLANTACSPRPRPRVMTIAASNTPVTRVIMTRSGSVARPSP